MLKMIIDSYKRKKREKKIEELQLQYELCYARGFTIRNLVVSEFNYLFQYILREAKQNDELELSSEHFDQIVKLKIFILRAISIELAKDELQEQKTYKLSYDLAIINMKNLEMIINTIVAYQTDLKNF